MSRILLFIALVAFIIGAVIAILVDNPEGDLLWTALFVGLACFVGSYFAPRDLP